MGEKKEFLVRFAKQYMQGHKDIDYFMFGHEYGVTPMQYYKDLKIDRNEK